MKTKIKAYLISFILLTLVGMGAYAHAASSSEPSASPSGTALAIEKIINTITLSGAIELDYSYADDSDVSNRNVNDSTSDLDVGTAQIGIAAQLHEWVSAAAVLKGESLDSSSNVFWDETYFKIQGPDMPLYLVAGKRAQPFGVFNSSFISDPVTQDLYEINDTGLTIGLAPENMMGMDLSFTVYKGETLITRAGNAGFGWARDNNAGYTATNDVNSYILSGSISPAELLSLCVFFNSEPGDSDLNNTLGAALHFEMEKFSADAEYITALDREMHIADSREYKENAWTVSMGYQVLDPLLVAIRYEAFDADKKADGNLENRYGIAGTWTLFKKDSFVCNLMAEYRRSEYETIPVTSVDEKLNEFFARLAIEF